MSNNVFWFKRKLNEWFPRDFIGVAGWPSLDFEGGFLIYCLPSKSTIVKGAGVGNM
jgi:hypothetical protein